MRFGRLLPALTAFAAAAVALMVLAGAGTAANVTRATTSAWTVAKAKSYLRSMGIDPRSVVIQQGKRNYAGPHCPGKGWTCTKAKRVLQISAIAITNKFTCKGATAGTDPGTNTCVVVQGNASADNDARCFLTDVVKNESSNAQSCSITQTNGTGKNFAWVIQDLRMYDSATETGNQHVTVKQTNRAGNNEVTVDQTLIQSSVVTAPTIDQVQEARQDVGVDQHNGTGSNTSGVRQSLQLRAVVFSGLGAISQSQDTVNAGPNTLANISQIADSGANSSTLQQYNRLEAQAASKNGPVTQKQGSTTGGLHGEVHQSSSGVSTTTSHQDEDQIAHATTPPGTLTQVQIGPMYCCGASSSVGNGSNSVSMSQTGHQESDGGSQVDTAQVQCRSSGTCTSHQHKDNNVDTLTVDDSCQGSVASPCTLDRTVQCDSESCSTFTGEGSSTPLSTVLKEVRNVTTEGSFGPTTFTSFGNTIEFRITYSNTGTGTAHSVTLSDTVPSSISFTSCTGGCVASGGTLTWALGNVAPGTSVVVTFRGTYGETCSGASNTATADSAEEAPVTSNAATVTVLC